MQNISVEVIAVIGFAVLMALSLLMRLRRPKEKTFKCARCSTIAPHTPRTIEAWRSGKKKFFCNACHAQWLRSHPSPVNNRSEKSGCLGVFAFFIAIPCLLIASWWGYT